MFLRKELVVVVLDARDDNLFLAERLDFLLSERNTQFSNIMYVRRIIGGVKPPHTQLLNGGDFRDLKETTIPKELKLLRSGCYFVRCGNTISVDKHHYKNIISILRVILGEAYLLGEKELLHSALFPEDRRAYF